MEETHGADTHTDPGAGGASVAGLQEEGGGEDFGLRYRPQLDACFLRLRSKEHVEHVTPAEAWARQKLSCKHLRWHRENLLGSTYFTCVRCGWRRRQAVPPTSGTFSLQDAERLFEARYPRRHDAPPQEQDNADIMRQWQEVARRERHPVEVARTVCARDMLQSGIYRRVAAEVHAATHLDGDVQALARHYTAALQVLQTRISRMCNDRARQRKANKGGGKGKGGTAGRGQHQDNTGLTATGSDKSEEGATSKTRHHNIKNKCQPSVRCAPGRERVLAGYFYACVSLHHYIFLDGKVFQRLQLVHQRLRCLFPGLPRDLSTHTYLETLTPRLFPRLTPHQQTDLKTKARDLIYSAARHGTKAPKRSLICCALLTVAQEERRKVSDKNVRLLMHFDSHHKKWHKVMRLLGGLSGSVTHENEEEQTRLEELLDEEEPIPDPDCDALMEESQRPVKRRAESNEAPLADKQKDAKRRFISNEKCVT